jgi:hypothetical protein
MRKVDSLYSSLIDIASNICDDSQNVEAFWETLEDAEKEIFDLLSENIALEKQNLQRCKSDKQLYENYELLSSYFNKINDDFSGFPGLCIKKINYILTLSNKVFQNIADISDEDVSSELGYAQVDLGFESLAFVSNIPVLNKNIIWFDPSSNDSLEKLITFDTNIECWYSLLGAVDGIDFDSEKEIIFSDSQYIDSEQVNSNITSLLRIYMASSGEQIVSPLCYSRPPLNSSLALYCPSMSYAQFDDIINILGEYNNRQDTLAKYLSIFHIIENFMFKFPIVKLERSSGGQMFSIRDFKRLYKSVDVNELKAVTNLFNNSFKLPFNGETLNKYLYRKWEAFKSTHILDMSNIKNFTIKLTSMDAELINEVEFCNFLSKVVYQIRCSIVHNKETEFHISSENYPTGCRLIIEEYILGMLEEVMFFLLSSENDIVWYRNDSIKLWERSA